MRKIEDERYQYHIRLFSDREIRCHYKYAPDAYPVRHLLASCFERRANFFKVLLKDFLVVKK